MEGENATLFNNASGTGNPEIEPQACEFYGAGASGSAIARARMCEPFYQEMLGELMAMQFAFPSG